MRLSALINDIDGILGVEGGEASEVEITGVSSDSRRVEPGDLFIALPGQRTDGAHFLLEARSRGARAALAGVDARSSPGLVMVRSAAVQRVAGPLASRFFGDPSRSLTVVGVTGTNGKTTVTYLLEAVWRAAGLSPGVIGTVSYRFAGRSRRAPLTTPEAVDFQRLLAAMQAAGVSHVAVEVSSHALALERVTGTAWNAAVFTSFGRDHLDFHPSMEDYFEAKARLFTEHLAASPKAGRVAVVNVDDEWGRRLAKALGGRVVTYGRTGGCRVERLALDMSGFHATARLGEEICEISAALLGEHNVANALAAAATARALGATREAIESGIGAVACIPGRMERVSAGGGATVLVDYAHTPAALERALGALRDLARGRLIVVFGCGGDRDRGKRAPMGRVAARLADLVILTNDNPRGEDPGRILREIERGVLEEGCEEIEAGRLAAAEGGYAIVPERRRALALAIEGARPADVVLIAGKGHEAEQIVGTKRCRFDDRVEARRVLANRVRKG